MALAVAGIVDLRHWCGEAGAMPRHLPAAIAAAVLLVASAAQAKDQRPLGAGSGRVVAHVALLGGPDCTVQANGKGFPATKGFPLIRSDELVVPPGEFMVVNLTNGYLVRVDEDLTVAVSDLANLDAPPTHESLTAQLDRLVTAEEKGRAERIAGAQARLTAARTVAPEMQPAPAPSAEAAPPPPPPSLQPAPAPSLSADAAPPPPPPSLQPAPAPPPPSPSSEEAPPPSGAPAPSQAPTVAKKKASVRKAMVSVSSATGVDASVAQAVLEALAGRLHRCAVASHARSEVLVQLSVARSGDVQTISFKTELPKKLQACLRHQLVRAHFAAGPSRIQASLALARSGH